MTNDRLVPVGRTLNKLFSPIYQVSGRTANDSDLESRGAVSNEGRAGLRHTVREGELEVGSEELLDVWAADIISLLDLNNLEDLLWQDDQFTVRDVSETVELL